ncbi:MAG: hypothetical protein ACLQG3_07995 [Terracidiphilus sp.]
MPLLGEEQLLASAAKRATSRIKTAGTKLNTDELAALEKHCRDRNITPGELIRRLVFAELERGKTELSPSEPMLTEILGVRLLLVNVLRPLAAGQKVTPETFDRLLNEISTAKHELAQKLMSERRR